ncbi:MAG: formylglycine-generating enzyme family protein [Burkholderiaceae bacterium]
MRIWGARAAGVLAIAAGGVFLQDMAHAGRALNAIASPILGDPQSCAVYNGLPIGFGSEPRAGMLSLPAGEFEPGTDHGYPDERPAGRVKVAQFWIDRTDVTNAQFSIFVNATGYVTEAEREGAAAVFQAPASIAEVEHDGSWWHYVRGADWRHPEGLQSNLKGREHDPVVQVTLADARAYAHWLGRDLPTEAEWEYAARGNGQEEKIDRAPRDAVGKPTANYWQGVFPEVNTREDGYAGRSPVGCFPANGYGLYDLIGNVWQWTTDAYAGPRQIHDNGDPFASVTAAGAPLRRDTPMVIKGGSFLCAANYCTRYRAAARYPQEANLATAHVGFKTVWRGS